MKQFDAIVYTAEFGNLDSTIFFGTFEMDDWHAIPSYKPKVLPLMNLGDPNGVNISMSWNSATDVDSWKIN